MNNLTITDKILVIARSARMLAQLAVWAGNAPIAIDCFADTDTQALALESIKVNSLGLADLHVAVESVAGRHGLTHVIYGSGFEEHIDSLRYLQTRFVVLGNSAELMRRLQDKQAFFGQLEQLGICYPHSVFSTPSDDADWLIKPVCGEGGAGISIFAKVDVVDRQDVYWQRRLDGEVYSVLFVASQGRVKLLGFNRQWPVDADAGDFVFSGICNHAELAPGKRSLLAEWFEKLVGVYPLQGLGSLDFILHEQQCYLLEINARIPASAQLYGQSMLALHCQACAGVLDEIEAVEPLGYQVVFAAQDTVIPAGMIWPDCAIDRPADGAFVGKGEPVCSIIAGGMDADQVVNRLRHQKNIIEQLLNTGF
ncbi:MAG: ATP-dependent carboxylate-amine ligase [Methylomonas sp.]|nr:MAG: ATP-dependent carboxylate-amine ligase [Methylomonas sp.]